MKKSIKSIITLGVLMIITACAPSISDYKDNKPRFAFEEFFNGPVMAHGIVQDRSGKVTRRFTVDMRGSWDGDNGKLEEDFAYDDGEKQRRVWKVTRLADGRYTGMADDIVGTATGVSAGNAIQWSYVMQLPVKGRIYNITFDDWMYLMPDGTLMNRSTLSKFGIRVADVIIFMQKSK